MLICILIVCMCTYPRVVCVSNIIDLSLSAYPSNNSYTPHISYYIYMYIYIYICICISDLSLPTPVVHNMFSNTNEGHNYDQDFSRFVVSYYLILSAYFSYVV